MALAALVLVFAAFYPYLDATGSCGEPGCPEFSHASLSVELPTGAFAALFGTVLVAPVLAGHARRRPASDRKPADLYLPPEPEPPRS